MSPKRDGTGLKRALPASVDEEDSELKKPRRSERIRNHPPTPHTPLKGGHLPSPMTKGASNIDDGTKTPISDPTEIQQPMSPYINEPTPSQTMEYSQTQRFSQGWSQVPTTGYEVPNEEREGVWGYLIPVGMADSFQPLVLKNRSACTPDTCDHLEKKNVPKDTYLKQEESIEKTKEKGKPSRGYLLGRHPECDFVIDAITVSNRHCLLFSENKDGKTIAMLEDTSGNGTFVNDALVGRNNRRELRDGDEISIIQEAHFYFKYPKHRMTSAFKQSYVIMDQLGKGHFATVYLGVDKTSGQRWAIKKFDVTKEKNRLDGLQQEIAVLMGISHPSLLCLKGAFDEDDGVYLILELAPEGELFNLIVMKQKLTEVEARRIFVQLFQAIKYLHERGIVHRDIKPENILLADKNLTVKVADFGLAKIIGEDSFTTTLCGTPSYVAPEILQPSKKRRYTRAVDIWSLGVVLYICLCGFPPFSDELYTVENPYTLAQQIMHGRYDFPSPYWDSVGDPALDLIEKMLTVDPEQRITVEGCLEHPWTTGNDMGPAGESVLSDDGLLAGRMTKLDFVKRRPVRERTLLSTLNDVHVAKILDVSPTKKGRKKEPGVKVFTKNKEAGGASQRAAPKSQAVVGAVKDAAVKEAGGSGMRFLATGQNGDVELFAEDESSRYAKTIIDDSL